MDADMMGNMPPMHGGMMLTYGNMPPEAMAGMDADMMGICLHMLWRYEW